MSWASAKQAKSYSYEISIKVILKILTPWNSWSVKATWTSQSCLRPNTKTQKNIYWKEPHPRSVIKVHWKSGLQTSFILPWDILAMFERCCRNTAGEIPLEQGPLSRYLHEQENSSHRFFFNPPVLCRWTFPGQIRPPVHPNSLWPLPEQMSLKMTIL